MILYLIGLTSLTNPLEEIFKTEEEFPKKDIKYFFGNDYYPILEEESTYDCDLEMDISPKKEIVSSRSFGKPVTTLNELQEAASSYCIRAVEKLRSQHSVASGIMVYIATNPFKDEPQYVNFANSRLSTPSAFTPDFLSLVNKDVKTLFRDGYKYKKVGVMINDIVSEENAPLDFFEPSYLDDERKTIMDCVDNINKKMGNNKVTYAKAGTKQKWKMKREKLTPQYTTKWDELPIVED